MNTTPIPKRLPEGIALVVVMIAVFVLTVLAGAFAFSMKVETKLAMNANNEVASVWLGRSGVEYARWLLAREMTCGWTDLNQMWAGGPGDDCETNAAFGDISLSDIQVGDRKISLKITDLESMANINTADQTMLEQALTEAQVEGGDLPSIAGAILDWIHPPRSGGVESDYYESLSPPYDAKNGPMDDISELRFVRGVTDEMYWGSASTNHAPAVFQRQGRLGSPADETESHPGLHDLFTTISTGKINVNTASREVLELIPGVEEGMVDEILRQRDQSPFHNLNEVPVPPPVMQQLQRWGDVRSSTFRVEVTVEGSSRKFVAIVRRNAPRDIPILSFYWMDPEQDSR